MDTTILEYTGNHWLTYQDPKVLAVVAAAPYFEDVDIICDYDYAWQNTTSWSRTEGGGHGTTVQVDLEAGQAAVTCPDTVTVEDLTKAVVDAGYTVKGID